MENKDLICPFCNGPNEGIDSNEVQIVAHPKTTTRYLCNGCTGKFEQIYEQGLIRDDDCDL